MSAKINKTKRKRVTMKDIAEKTGYTVNTVSHALHDKDDISESAKKIIREAAEKLGYIGDSLAGSLRTGVTNTVAVIIGDVSNPHFAILVKELDEAAAESGYCTIILNTDENPEKELSAIKTAVGKKVDGIIICPTQKDCTSVSYLRKLCIPYVLMGRRDGMSDCVVSDDEKGGYLAAKHLLAKGHEKIMYLGGNSCISSARERLSGYRKAMEETGKSPDEKLICEADGIEEISEIISEIYDSGKKYTAILAFSDIMAFEAVRCLSERGVKVPGDVEVIGFDNIQKSMPFLPPISSVEASENMGRLAFSLLMKKLMAGGDGKKESVVIEPRVVVR